MLGKEDFPGKAINFVQRLTTYSGVKLLALTGLQKEYQEAEAGLQWLAAQLVLVRWLWPELFFLPVFSMAS